MELQEPPLEHQGTPEKRAARLRSELSLPLTVAGEATVELVIETPAIIARAMAVMAAAAAVLAEHPRQTRLMATAAQAIMAVRAGTGETATRPPDRLVWLLMVWERVPAEPKAQAESCPAAAVAAAMAAMGTRAVMAAAVAPWKAAMAVVAAAMEAHLVAAATAPQDVIVKAIMAMMAFLVLLS